MATLNFKKNRSLSNGMPNMATTLNGWEVPLSLVKIKQRIIDGDKQEIKQVINFLGVWQPLSDEQLQSKAEGQRSWSWYWIHAKSGTLDLKTQDLIEFNGKKYKVMAVKDYSLNGFIEYHVIRDYENE